MQPTLCTRCRKNVAVIFITIVLSFFTLVLGELVPKRVAMRNPEGLARRVCGVIAGLSKAMRPVVWLLSVSTNGGLRLFGINPNEASEDVSEEDILDLVDAVEEQGEIDNDTKEVLDIGSYKEYMSKVFWHVYK